MNNVIKILIVSLSESIHTARWIGQLSAGKYDLHVFPSIDYGRTHPRLSNVTVHHSLYAPQENVEKSNKYRGVKVPLTGMSFFGRKLIKKIYPNYRRHQLIKVINKVQPDIIHSMELQAGAYITLEAIKKINKKPPWIVTNWGSDIYLFGNDPKHKERIKEVLKSCDYYSSECQRDVKLAIKYGFKGTVLPVIPNAGGYKLDQYLRYRKEPVSKRKLIMLKGYQGWSGRAVNVIKALERCKRLLERRNYKLLIYSSFNNKEILNAVERLKSKVSISVEILPDNLPHEEIMKFHGQARISIGNSISDGISTSFLEALVMGSFPIQSNTSCADEWVENGKNAILVSPEDIEEIANAIQEALKNDNLVDKASKLNSKTANSRLAYSRIQDEVIDMYKHVYDNSRR